MTGRSPSGSGHSAEPEPSCTVSAVPVSVPNASWAIGHSSFGDYIRVGVPPGCDAVIVCINRYGHQPVTLLLPHQLYVKLAQKLLREHGAQSLTIFPVRSGEKVTIPASAIEARSDATGTGAAEGESAIPKGDAQP